MKRKKIIIVSLLWLVVLILLMIINVLYTSHILDSDMSSELILARELAKENSIVSLNWYYSTELRIVSAAQVYAFFFKFVSSFALIRILSNFCIYLLMSGSMFFFLKMYQFSTRDSILGGILFLLPVSEDYLYTMEIGCFYSLMIAQLLTIFGILKVVNGVEHKNKKQMAGFVFAGILAFLLGAASVRAIFVLAAPIVVYVGFCVAYKKDSIESCKDDILICIATIFGFLLNKLLLCRIFDFWKMENVVTAELLIKGFFGRIETVVLGVLNEYGYRAGVPIYTVRGILSVLIVPTVILLFIIAIHAFCKNQDQREKKLILIFISMLVAMLACIMLTDIKFYDRYVIHVYVFVIPLLLLWVKKRGMKRAVAIFLVSLCLVSSFFTVKDLILIDHNMEQKKVAEYLIEHHYDFGYASFWNSNILVELTNGKLTLSSVDFEKMELYDWLVCKKNRMREMKKKKRFLVMTDAENNVYAGWILAQNIEQVYAQDGYYIYRLHDAYKYFVE